MPFAAAMGEHAAGISQGFAFGAAIAASFPFTAEVDLPSPDKRLDPAGGDFGGGETFHLIWLRARE